MDKFDRIIIEIIGRYNDGEGIGDPTLDRMFQQKTDYNEISSIGLNGSGLFKKVRTLREDGFVEKKADGKGYILTNKGREFL